MGSDFYAARWGGVLSDRLFPVSLEEQIRCVERELKMRGRVYTDRVDRKRMSPQEADREIEAMTAVLGTLKVCEQLAKCLDDAPRIFAHPRSALEGSKVIQVTDELAKQIAAQLRGEDISSGPR